MKKTALVLFLAVAAVLAAGVLPASAHGGGGVHGSIWIGPGWWGPPYYPYYPPYYYYYQQPPVVIQQPDPVYEYDAPPAQQQYYWYFCPGANNYYPYVKQCPGGWKKVVPTPPDKGKEK